MYIQIFIAMKASFFWTEIQQSDLIMEVMI